MPTHERWRVYGTPHPYARARRRLWWLVGFSVLAFLIGLSQTKVQGAQDDVVYWGLLVSALSLITATVGMISTAVLGWRADRRQVTESELKMEQLNLELEKLRKERDATGAGGDPPPPKSN